MLTTTSVFSAVDVQPTVQRWGTQFTCPFLTEIACVQGQTAPCEVTGQMLWLQCSWDKMHGLEGEHVYRSFFSLPPPTPSHLLSLIVEQVCTPRHAWLQPWSVSLTHFIISVQQHHSGCYLNCLRELQSSQTFISFMIIVLQLFIEHQCLQLICKTYLENTKPRNCTIKHDSWNSNMYRATVSFEGK